MYTSFKLFIRLFSTKNVMLLSPIDDLRNITSNFVGLAPILHAVDDL